MTLWWFVWKSTVPIRPTKAQKEVWGWVGGNTFCTLYTLYTFDTLCILYTLHTLYITPTRDKGKLRKAKGEKRKLKKTKRGTGER